MALICFWALFEDLLKSINMCSPAVSFYSFVAGSFWEQPFHQGEERVWVYLCHHMADVAKVCLEGAEESTLQGEGFMEYWTTGKMESRTFQPFPESF